MESTIHVDGVFFDLGNTLIPFTPRDSMEFVVKWYRSSIEDEGSIPFPVFLKAFRSMVRSERNRSEKELWESSVEFRSGELSRSLGAVDGLEQRLRKTHSDCFSSCLRMRSSARYVIDQILNSTTESGTRPVLGLISNAMDHVAIRTFLKKESLIDLFDPLIISAEVGLTKPHREIFEMALKLTSLDPGRTLYVGDRYVTDILGSRKAGMLPVYTREYHTAGEPPEGMEIESHTIKNILDLITLLRDPSIGDIHG